MLDLAEQKRQLDIAEASKLSDNQKQEIYYLKNKFEKENQKLNEQIIEKNIAYEKLNEKYSDKNAQFIDKNQEMKVLRYELDTKEKQLAIMENDQKKYEKTIKEQANMIQQLEPSGLRALKIEHKSTVDKLKNQVSELQSLLATESEKHKVETGALKSMNKTRFMSNKENIPSTTTLAAEYKKTQQAKNVLRP